MMNLRFVTSESQSFATVEEMFNNISTTKGCIPTAAVKIGDGELCPYSNAFEAMRFADIVKNIAHKRVTLVLYKPEIVESGAICIVTEVYE